MSSKTEDVFVPVDDLEKELDSVVQKLKTELRKTHSRNADLTKKLQLKEKQTNALYREKIEVLRSMEILDDNLHLLKKKNVELENILSNEREQAVEKENSLKHRLETKETELQGKEEAIEKNKIDMEALNKHISDSKIYIEKMQSRIGDMAAQKTKDDLMLKETVEGLQGQIQVMAAQRMKDDLLHKETVEGLQKQIQVMAAKRTNETLEHKSAVKELQEHMDKERKSFYDLSFQYSQLIQAKQSSEDLKSTPGYQEHKAKSLLLPRQDKGQQTDISHSQADLSDEKRPTKLAEEFSMLYDYEWTDAFEDLLEENEMQKCQFMLKLLKRANKICLDASIEHRNAIKRSLCTLTVKTELPTGLDDIETTGEVYDEVPGRLAADGSKSTRQAQGECDDRNGRKNVAKQERTIETDFERTLRKEQEKDVMDLGRVFEIQQSEEVEKVGTEIVLEEQNINQHQKSLVSYIQKCMNICWSMCRHVPPVHVDFTDVTGDIRFDTAKYKQYWKSGSYLQYIVWPALYLHDGGPLLCKGVAQGRNVHV